MLDFREYVRWRLPDLGLPPEREIEIVEELALQLEQAYSDALHAGVSEDEALGRMGGQIPDWRALAREIRLAERPIASRLPEPLRASSEGHGGIMVGFVQDLRYAFRLLGRSPGFTAVAVLTLSLGIGANTAIFSVVSAALLRSLPGTEPGRLTVISEQSPRGGHRMSVADPNFQDWLLRAKSFQEMAAYRAAPLNLTGVERPVRLDGRMVSWNFFRVLGVKPQLGRFILEEEDRPEASRTAVISDAFWQRQFGADPEAIGRTLTLNGETHTIVGVLPAGFELFRKDDVYVPLGHLRTPGSAFLDRGNHFDMSVLARLAPGLALAEAQAEMSTIAAQLAREYPATNSGNGARVEPLAELLVESIRPALLVLMGAVVAVLLIACVNLANLLLARGAAREQELAIRAALGAGRLRVVRQLLTECVLLSVLGGMAGLVLAYWGLPLLRALVPAGVTSLENVRIDAGVLGFAAAVSLLTGVVFGLLPALRASRAGLSAAARSGGRSPVMSPTRPTLRKALLVAEVSLAFVLLAGAGLMLRTVQKLTRTDPGFDPTNILTVRFNLAGETYDPARRRTFYRDVLPKLEALPGVQSAALTLSIPVDGSNWNSVFIVADQPVPRDSAELPSSAFTPVSTGYFRTLKIRLLSGRLFTEHDRADASPVAVVNESMARRFWPNADPIGKRLKQGWPEQETPWREIVGVVADVKANGIEETTPLQTYLPLDQEPFRSLRLLVRTASDPAGAAHSVERAMHEVEKDLPLFDIRTMEEVLQGTMGRQRLLMILLGTFAALALGLAAVGIFGVMAYSVAQRRHELGVRMALGAEMGDVLRLVLGQGIRPALAGVGLGLAGAALLTGFLQSLLFEVKPTDPMTYAGVALILTGVALAACYIPARRAARVDPAVALRYE